MKPRSQAQPQRLQCPVPGCLLPETWDSTRLGITQQVGAAIPIEGTTSRPKHKFLAYRRTNADLRSGVTNGPLPSLRHTFGFAVVSCVRITVSAADEAQEMEPKLSKTRVKRKRYMKVQNIDTHHPTPVHINLEITLLYACPLDNSDRKVRRNRCLTARLWTPKLGPRIQ